MASGEKMNPDSDDEVDVEALRLAALQTLHAKPKFTPHINHSNLIPIVPVNVVAPIIVHPAIKLEPISPTREENIQVNPKSDSTNKGDEDRDSLGTDSEPENDDDILSMDDKEEEDSLERLMDQLEAEISGKAIITSNRTVIAPKKSLNELKGSHKKGKKSKRKDLDVELVEVKIGKQQGPIINIRESVSPESSIKTSVIKNISPARSRNSPINSRSPRKSRSPFRRSRSYRRSISPYWLKSPHRSRSLRRSRSPFRRSRSSFWSPRRSKTPLRKSRSPYRSKSPFGRRRSPFRYCSRSRSRSFERRSRSPWSYSSRKRSRSPHFRDSFSPFHRRRNLISPDNKSRRRSISPYDKSRSPRHRSRSPRRFLTGRRISPFHRSKSPNLSSRSPVRNKSPFRRAKSPYRRSTSPFSRRSKSPMNPVDSSHQKRRSPLTATKSCPRRSKSLDRRSPSIVGRPRTPEGNSKAPAKRVDGPRRSRSLSQTKRSRSCTISPRRRNRSPFQKNKMEENEKLENNADRSKAAKKPRSISRERRNEYYRRHDRRPHRSRGFRRFSPSKGRRSLDRQRKRSRSPRKKIGDDKPKETETPKNLVEDKGTSPLSVVPVDPVLEARKKKFENLNEVDPTVDKKISLKSIKESTDNTPLEEDDDALNINLESDLWEESEESENEFESRFKTNEARTKTNRTVLSFRSLRDDDAKKINLNKPLIDETRQDKYNNSRFDRWHRGRRNDRNDRPHRKKYRDENDYSARERKFESPRNKSQDVDSTINKKAGRKVIVFSSPKRETHSRDNEVSTTSNVTNVCETKNEKELVNPDKVQGTNDKHKPDKNRTILPDTDDFERLISAFEKELESDNCLPISDETDNNVAKDQNEVKRLKISVKKDLFQPRTDLVKRKPLSRGNEISSIDKVLGNNYEIRKKGGPNEVAEIKDQGDKLNKLEDYVEDDDFVLDGSYHTSRNRDEEEGKNDLRDILSQRRNERLTKAVSLTDKLPNRLVQSAFQGLGNKKLKRGSKEIPPSSESPSKDRNISVGTERRRVLLLQRKKPDVPSFKVTVPEVKPDTTIHQRLTHSDERKRSRKTQKLESMDELDQEEEDCVEAEEKAPRRFRLKRNVTLGSQ